MPVDRIESPGVGTGIYTVTEAAELLKVPRDKLKRWTDGYSKSRKRGTTDEETGLLFPKEGYPKAREIGSTVTPPVIDREGSEPGLLTFYDLIELAFVCEFRKLDVSTKVIWKAAAVLREQMGTPYPFATKRFTTDGSAIIEKEKLIDAVTKQRLFMFATDFFKQIRVGADGLAEAWYPLGQDQLIVLDPKRQYGAPIDVRSGIRTDIIYRQYLAEGDVDAVANWYEITVEAVNQAIKFEEQWRKAA